MAKTHKTLIKKIVELKRGLNPMENRYVDKRVREELKLQMPKVSKRLPEYLNPAEIYQIFEVTSRTPFKTFDNLLVKFLIFTGLRISEANNLLVESIDFDNNQIKVVQGKGSKDRYVVLSQSLKELIRAYLNGRKKGWLFCKQNLKHYSVRALQVRIMKIYKAAGFTKHLTTHSLRHTFACMLLSKGMTIDRIKLLMGHSSVKTTEIYAKLELGTVKEDYQRLIG